MPKPPPNVEAKMLDRLRVFAAKNPRLGLMHSHLLEMAAECFSVVPKPRETEGEPRRSARSMAVKTPVRPSAASNPPNRPGAGSQPLSVRERAIQRRRADPTACAVLALIANGAGNRDISERLNLTIYQVKRYVAAWMKATEVDGRASLATWARGSGILAGSEAQR